MFIVDMPVREALEIELATNTVWKTGKPGRGRRQGERRRRETGSEQQHKKRSNRGEARRGESVTVLHVEVGIEGVSVNAGDFDQFSGRNRVDQIVQQNHFFLTGNATCRGSGKEEKQRRRRRKKTEMSKQDARERKV
jgi:hypothetical protein